MSRCAGATTGKRELGESCSRNADCITDFCKNGDSGTSVGCSGTCMTKLPVDGDCSNSALNIPFDGIDLFGSEHAACSSGKCSCGVCTANGSKLPANHACAEDEDCQSEYCKKDSRGSSSECKPYCGHSHLSHLVANFAPYFLIQAAAAAAA